MKNKEEKDKKNKVKNDLKQWTSPSLIETTHLQTENGYTGGSDGGTGFATLS